MTIREVDKPKLTDLIRFSHKKNNKDFNIQSKDILEDILITGSGKGAIAIILEYLREKTIIKNKLDEILVPDWLGYWVYNQIQAYAFPVKKVFDRTKVIFVYHQYGFPQDMDKILDFAHDKKLIVIEDCAHAIDSYYKGRPVGSFGDFSIYSFSKWFSCFASGGVKSKFEDFNNYASAKIKKTPFGLTFAKDITKFLYERSTFGNSKVFKKYTNLAVAMTYSFYGQALKPSVLSKRLIKAKINNEITVRQARYQYFIKETAKLGICDQLERDNITPYVIPVHSSQDKLEQLAKKLTEHGIFAGIYNFDIARNLLSPKFIPCLQIPCHAGMPDKVFDDITELVKKTL